MKVLAKGKSLLNKTSTKKQRASKRETDTNTPYTFDLNQEVVYCGSLAGYGDTICTIIGRSRKYITEYYRIRFENIDEIETIGDILKSKEDYEIILNEKKITLEMKERLAENNEYCLENALSCHNQEAFYHRGCDECYHDKHGCIYRYKYMYDKIKFN